MRITNMEDGTEKKVHYGDDMFWDVMAHLVYSILFPNKHMPIIWVQKFAQEFVNIYETDSNIYTRQPVQREE